MRDDGSTFNKIDRLLRSGDSIAPEAVLYHMNHCLKRNDDIFLKDYPFESLAYGLVENFLRGADSHKIIYPQDYFFEKMTLWDRLKNIDLRITDIAGKDFQLYAGGLEDHGDYIDFSVFGIDPEVPNSLQVYWNIMTPEPSMRSIPLRYCDLLENKDSAIMRQLQEEKRSYDTCYLYFKHGLLRYKWLIMDLSGRLLPPEELPRRPKQYLKMFGDLYYPWDIDGHCPHWHVFNGTEIRKDLHFFGTEKGAREFIENEPFPLHIRYV